MVEDEGSLRGLETQDSGSQDVMSLRTWGTTVLCRYEEKAGGVKPPLQVNEGLWRCGDREVVCSTKGQDQVRWSWRTVMLAMRSSLGVKPIPGVVGTWIVPFGVTVTSGVITSSCQ